MGSGMWSADAYAATTKAKIGSGTNFGYHSRTMKSQVYEAHPDLDPKKVAGPKSLFAGEVVRESRDNDEHPNSVPIILGFDSTGSMGTVPMTVQEKLGQVFNMMLDNNYVEDPQVMISTYGDAYSDRVSLQVSQFESDNRIDDNLDNLFLEGAGGANGGETATLLLYYAAHHTITDAWEKRNKKGYIFIIADERMHDLRDSHVENIIGDKEPLGGLTAKEISEDVTKKWEVYVLLIQNLSARQQESDKQYAEMFGKENVLPVNNPGMIAETIALATGILEGNTDPQGGADALLAAGAKSNEVKSVLTTLLPMTQAKGFTPAALTVGSHAARF